MSHRILNIDDGKTELFLSVVPKTVLDETLKRYQAYDIDAEILPVDADLLSNATSLPYEAIIDIGHSRTLCILSLEGKSIQIRTVPKGMKDIHDALTKHFPDQDAVQLLSSTHLLAPSIMVEEEDTHLSPDAVIVKELQKNF